MKLPKGLFFCILTNLFCLYLIFLGYYLANRHTDTLFHTNLIDGGICELVTAKKLSIY